MGLAAGVGIWSLPSLCSWSLNHHTCRGHCFGALWLGWLTPIGVGIFPGLVGTEGADSGLGFSRLLFRSEARSRNT